MIRETVMQAHEAARRRGKMPAVRRGRFAFSVKIMARLKATRIDLGKAQIVFSDDKGEMKLENVDGKNY